jgi:TonB family protein
MKIRFSRWLASCVRILILLLASFSGAFFAYGQASTPDAAASPRRVKIAEAVASALLIQKAPIQYPDAARKAAIQGTVVLNVVINEVGGVKEVTVSSGDSTLAQAALDSVKQWKYKPYAIEGSPVEVDTQVSINFHVKATSRPAPPPLGTFRDGNYANEYFGLFYPLSRDWVRETDLMRKNYSAEGQPVGIYVLLAAVHIPEHTAPPEADSSLVLSALERSAGSGTQTCDTYLTNVATQLQSRKEAQQKGSLSEFTVAGHDFRRADFEFHTDPRHHAIICTHAKDYLLQWNIAGLFKNAVEGTVSTLNSLTASQPQSPAPEMAGGKQLADKPAARVSSGITQGLVLKKVPPLYPEQARRARIQGSVHMSVVISKTGDVVDVEVIDGPIELVVSAVNAVRQWKYRPYVLQGEPVAVDTVITVNYTLSGA